jgi:hypothetical protein
MQSTTTIWANMQMQSADKSILRRHGIKKPSNWTELKLALSAPLSQRYFTEVKQAASRLNSNPLDSSLNMSSALAPTSALGGGGGGGRAKKSLRMSNVGTAPASLGMNRPLTGDRGMGASAPMGASSSWAAGGGGGNTTASTNNQSLDGGHGTGHGTGHGGNTAHSHSHNQRPGTTGGLGTMNEHATGGMGMGSPSSSPHKKQSRALRTRELRLVLEPIIKNKTKLEAKDEFRRLFAS